MDSREMGRLIFRLRKERRMTQRQIAEKLHVSPQAVSKWECGQGCPDVSLLPALSELFGVTAERLLSGNLAPKPMEAGNLKRLKFYVCPNCGNVLTASGSGELHCCGRKLESLKARSVDQDHAVTIRAVEEDWYITYAHPMEKGHYIRFAAYVAVDFPKTSRRI